MAFTITVKSNTRSFHLGPDDIRTAKTIFLIQTDDPGYGPGYVQAALASFGVYPSILSVYQSYGGSLGDVDAKMQVLDIDIVQAGDNDMEWEATVSYGPWDPFSMGTSPILLPAELATEGQNFQAITDQDINGNPLINTAGDPYDPGIEIDKQRQVIRVTINLQTYPNFAVSYTDYLNATPVWGFDQKTLKQAPIQVERLFHPNCGKYFKCHFLFDQNPLGWQAQRMNVGFRQLVSGVQQPIYDSTGQVITTPLPLDSAGRVITPPVNSSALITNKYDVYNVVDFNSLYAIFGSLP